MLIGCVSAHRFKQDLRAEESSFERRLQDKSETKIRLALSAAFRAFHPRKPALKTNRPGCDNVSS